MARRLAWEPTRNRRVCASPRGPGSDGGPSLGRPSPPAREGGAGEWGEGEPNRSQTGEDPGFPPIPSLVLWAAATRLWCPGDLRAWMEAWDAGTLKASESGPLPTSFYRKRKLLPTPTRPPKANPSFSLQEQGLGPWYQEWK